jgi:hypothetical protein
MSASETGGSAFPVSYTEEMDFNKGMTLRDYFAAGALQGLIACPEVTVTVSDSSFDKIAQWAYQYADAMLEARKE